MRNPKKVIFGSSADRGLDTLLSVWPEVKQEVPDAELVWAYGWDVYDKFHASNPQKMKWKYQMIRSMHEQGVTSLGRLSHEDLAKEFLSSGVWAYPTSFAEISCITAMKAQVAGCKVVTSGYAALQETVYIDEPEIELIHTKPDELKKFTQRLIKALQEPRDEDELKKVRQWALDNFSWEHVAKGWGDTISEGIKGASNDN